MDLIDMKLPKKTKKELKEYDQPIMAGERDRWPYGLQLRFETEQVELMPSLKDYSVGDRVVISAEAKVTEVRMVERQSTGGEAKPQYTVELQIEQIACEPKVKKPVEKMNPKEYRSMREKK